MGYKFEAPSYGDTIYYIDIDAKNKKIDIKKGTVVSIILSFGDMVFRLRNEEEDKEVDVPEAWCSESFENLANNAQLMLENINKHDVWSCFEED